MVPADRRSRGGGGSDPDRQRELLRSRLFGIERNGAGQQRLEALRIQRRWRAGTLHAHQLVAFGHTEMQLQALDVVERSDALSAEPKSAADLELPNPPFGKRSRMTLSNEGGEEDRDALTCEHQDSSETTSNKQLNFLQHIVCLLKR